MVFGIPAESALHSLHTNVTSSKILFQIFYAAGLLLVIILKSLILCYLLWINNLHIR